MKPSRHLILRRALTASFSSSAAKSKKSWKIFTADPPPSIKSQPPKTIKLTDDIRNSASFVGTVKGPVQRVDVPGVGVGASASLLVGDSSGKNGSFEILLKMQDKMAEMCLEHIKQNDFLHVSGRVESYTKTDENVKSQTCCEVIVKELNYVSESEHILIEESVGQLDLGESEFSPSDKSAGQSEANPTAKNAGKSNSVYLVSKNKERELDCGSSSLPTDLSGMTIGRVRKRRISQILNTRILVKHCGSTATMILLGLKSNFSSSTPSLEH